MNNLRIAQRAYDDMNEPEYHDYDSDPLFADFIEYVTLTLLKGQDCCGISAEILKVELQIANAGYRLASEIVSNSVTEQQFIDWQDS